MPLTASAFPLSKPQAGIFLHCLKNPDSTQFNLPVLVEIPEGVDAEMLCREMTERICSLDAVFTRFIMGDDGKPLQYYAERKMLQAERLEMSEEDFARYKRNGMIRPFNIFDEAPLARITLCSTEKSRYLITDIHHIICDGWTLNMLHDLSHPAPLSLPATVHLSTTVRLPATVPDGFAVGKNALNRKSIKEAVFADLSHHTDQRAGQQVRCSEIMEKSAIDTWCKEHGVTANDFFMSAFCVVMSRLTRLNTMGFYTMSHGRTDRQTRNAMGMFVRSVPMIASIDWSSDCLTLMKALHREHLSALRHSEHFTMSDLYEESGIAPAVYFNFLGWERMRECLRMKNGMALLAEQPCRPSVDDNLGVEIYLKGDDYEIRCQSSVAVNPEPVVRQVARSVRLVAQWMMENASNPLKEASLVSSNESSALMTLGEGEAMNFNPDDTFLTLFRRQALKTPDSIAIVDDERQITYAELLDESLSIAETLKAEGIKKGDCISIPMERKASFVAYTIATEMAGAIAPIFYTSGSTGSPKGVMVSHKAKANLIQFIARKWELTEKSRICCHSDFAFDASVEDLYPILTVGGTLFIMPEDIRRDIDQIHDFIIRNRITGGCFTTQLGQMLLQRYPDLPMDYLVVGGERMTVAPDCRCKLINTYGPTEFTVDATYHIIDKHRHYDTIPIGRPVANTSVYILDDCLQLIPKGMTGELCLAGVQMADGYIGDKELTDRKFVTTPFGKKVYRTGDLARWNDRGELEYVGRTDSQLKIRGYRVEPAEIEARMAEHPKVLMQTVRPFTAAGDTHLCAYYVADGEISACEMRAYLSTLLNDYMVPDAYMQLAEMPLTQSGKVDAKRLPQPKLTGSTEYIEPKDGLEQLIANAFAKVLGVEKVGATDDFFTLGGTSLNAIGVVVEAEKQGIKFPLNNLFKYKTPRAIAHAAPLCQPAALLCQPAATVPDGFAVGQTPTPRTAPVPEASASGLPVPAPNPSERPILLLGSTGFLGIHILHELLSDESRKRIICPVRPKEGKDPATRLKETYNYYFRSPDNPKPSLDHERLSVLTPPFGGWGALELEGVLVINCLANVNHFAADSSIMDVNVGMVRTLVDYCIRTNSHLIHISTISIAGIASKQKIGEGLVLTEKDYDIGQNVDFNEYIKSKFLAEGIILDAVRNKGLKASIMRVGNLSARSTDGKFQINPDTNAFHSAVQAITMLGCVPETMKNVSFDLSPVDLTARAILKLISIPDNNLIFHPFSSQPTYVSDIVKSLNDSGKAVRFVTDKEFSDIFRQAKQDPEKVNKLHALLAYDLPDNMERVPVSNDYTTMLLMLNK